MSGEGESSLKQDLIIQNELSEGVLFIFSSVVVHKWKGAGSTYHSRKSNTGKITRGLDKHVKWFLISDTLEHNAFEKILIGSLKFDRFNCKR